MTFPYDQDETVVDVPNESDHEHVMDMVVHTQDVKFHPEFNVI